MLKKIFIDFILFSFIESYIFKNIFERKLNIKFYQYEVLILGIGNCLISQLFPPIMYQILMNLYMTFMLIFLKNIKVEIAFKSTISAMKYFLVIEMPVCFIIELFTNIDFSIINYIKLLIINIPLKIMEIYLLKYIKKIRRCEYESMVWRS